MTASGHHQTTVGMTNKWPLKCVNSMLPHLTKESGLLLMARLCVSTQSPACPQRVYNPWRQCPERLTQSLFCLNSSPKPSTWSSPPLVLFSREWHFLRGLLYNLVLIGSVFCHMWLVGRILAVVSMHCGGSPRQSSGSLGRVWRNRCGPGKGQACSMHLIPLCVIACVYVYVTLIDLCLGCQQPF